VSSDSEQAPFSPTRPPPSGTVTFAFTDIEGSTQRWDRDPAAMRTALRRHDALVRAAIAGCGGHIFKTIGDAFCAAFSRPEDAIAAMVEAQRALGAEDFSAIGGMRIRAAIHTGTTDERDGDYFGPAVNRVARLLSVAHGGQVVVSGTTVALIEGALPSHATLRDLGEHRLKDLTRPERVYQLLAPDLPADFPPLRSLDARRNNLPVAVTSLVGRDAEIAEIRALLGAHRLVTVVGSGGIGKTRATLGVGADLLETATDGVWFVELAPLSNAEYLPTTVAQALGATLPAEGDTVENLVQLLENASAILIFDNCEHLVESTARLLSILLRRCQKLKLLASSRQALGIAGEALYRMQSLAIPDSAAAKGFTQADVPHYASTELFAERARAADRRFTVTTDNAPAIADICRRLDGIPLAIELAAARVKMLSPQQLRERLDERFRVLAGGSRDALPRQQTLRALIDWSYDLLDERERALFRRLAIFANGFTLAGAAAVGSAGDLDELESFDLLASLVDKSLVLAEPDGATLRYRLLESTRAYAREKLVAANELESAAARHLHFLRDYFIDVRSTETSKPDVALAAELEDVRAALDWSLTGAEIRVGAELMERIWGSWGVIGLYVEGMLRVEAFLAALPEEEPRLRARLWVVLAALAANSGRSTQAAEYSANAIAAARLSADEETLVEALAAFAWSSARVGKIEVAEAALAEAAAMPVASARGRRQLLESQSVVSAVRGDLDSAARALEQLLREYRDLGDQALEFAMSLNLAELEHERGRTPRAIAIVDEALPALRSNPDRNGVVQMFANLAGYRAAVDDLPGACAAAREAIAEFAGRETGVAFVPVAVEHLALALALSGELARAAMLAGYAEGAIVRHGYEREFTERTSHNRLVAVLRERLAPAELERAFTDGANLAAQDAVALALANE
jgi:predicted ATPase/class 3 adenylate cyclase